ncbi:macrolide ABC transporter ATP-binding protein/permease [Anaeromicrobium sediminis]|uniref:Macrolide ABC transporter ATP-binding protein/permease n=2 Tax=Anaeromicrobium sediminis TaxID=1478221 RepID=A0A267MES1_9FIRM|nr:macrolide ABC transporter ATP-binding protein/permease [Anaeromicrobium sediminis]
MTILKINNVNKYYKISKKETFQVLKNVNLSFYKGEFVSIIGESGSGKSTLMNLIGGLDSDFHGDILFHGKSISKFKEKELDAYRKNNIGFIFQSFNLIPHLSVLDNITIAMTLSNASKEEQFSRAKELLEEVGLEDQIYKKPNQLSGGQKQRVAIARALANDPDIILADEPTGALDSKTSEQILELLQKIGKRGKLIIAVTHSSKVANFGTRIVSISDGEIIKDDIIKEKIDLKEERAHIKKGKQNLSFFSAIKLALNNMRLNTWRNILISFGASIGITSVIIMLALGSGVKSYIQGEIQGNVDPLMIEVTKPSKEEMRGPITAGNPFTTEDIKEIEGIENAREIEKSSTISMKTRIEYKDKSNDVLILETLTKSFDESSVTYGQMPKHDEIIISKNVAENLMEEGEPVKNLVGTTVKLLIVEQKDNKPVQIEEEFTISGIMETSGQGMMGNFTLTYLNYDDLNQLYRDNGVEFGPTTLYVYGTNEKYIAHIKEEIKELGYEGSREEAILEQLMVYLNIATAVLAGIAGISLIVSGIMILVVLYISVIERTKEIGVLKAIGARRKDIKRIFFSEAALVGVIAGLIGVICAIFIGNIGNGILNRQFGVKLIEVKIDYMILGLLVSTIVSVVAGLSPASKAAKLDPIQSLRHE